MLFFEFVFDPAAPTTLYAAGAHYHFINFDTEGPDAAALVKSTDGGSTWTSIAQGLPAGLVDLAVDPIGSILYAATGGGLYTSDDGGGSWRRVEGITTEAVLAVSVPAHDQLYVVQNDAGVHWSSNGGASWTALNHGLEYFPANLLVVVPGRPPRSHSPRQPTTLYLGLFGGGLQSFSLP